MRKRILVVSLWMALGGLPQAWAQSNVVADSGFRPKPHGFSFENWGGNQHPHAKLTPDDAAYLFGDQACARKQDDVCVPTPGAKLWIEQMNKATEGGHCEGMAVLSAAFYVKQEKVDDFGARQAFELKPDDEWLMRTIAAYFTTQALEPVQSATNATKKWPLQKIVDHLAKTMKSGDDYPTLGIYGDAGGHAVTPYKIDQTGAGKYRIHIYDNNYPGAEKFIDVDVGRNEWIYSGAALNPKEDPKAWKGGAGSMDVTLLSTRYEPLKCPFCAPPGQQKPKPKPKPASAPGAKAPGAKAPGSKAPGAKAPGSKPKPKPKPKPQVVAAPKPKPAPKPKTPRPAAAPAQGYTVYTSSRCSQVQAVSKSSKQQIKMGADGADSQIDGASMRPLRGTRGCVVHLPKDQEYDVRLVDDGRPSSKPLTDLTVFGSGRVYQVSDVAIRPNATETVSFSPTNFNYQAGGKQKPTVRVADDSGDTGSYYEVSDFEIDEGHNFTAEEDDYGRYAFSDDDPELDDYDIAVEVVGDDETEYYEFEDVSPGDDGEVLMEIDEDGEFDMDVDTDGDGEGNYYDEDDDNDGSDDASDNDDDNDGVSDDSDADFVGEDYDDGEDDGADDGEDEADDGEDEADDGEDEADDGGDEADDGDGTDDAAEDGADEARDDESDEGEDDGADDGSAAEDDEFADDESDESEDASEDDGGDKSAMLDDGAEEDEGREDDSGEAESDDESAYEGEAADESEAGYDEESGEDEAASEAEAEYEEESAEDEAADEDEAEADYEDQSGEDEAAYEDEAANEDEAAYEDE
jgi:hypothetical protein